MNKKTKRGKPKVNPNQIYKKKIRSLKNRTGKGDLDAKQDLESELKKSSTARWIVKHLDKVWGKASKEKKAEKENLSREQEGLRLRVQSRGYGEGASIPHSKITKYGKDRKRD